MIDANAGTSQEPSNRKSRVLPVVVLALCLSLFLGKAVTSMVQESSTWDETCYFGLGKYLLHTHHWDVPGSILHPPLSYYIHSIPLLFFPMDEDFWQIDPSGGEDLNFRGTSDVIRGQALLSDPANKGDRLLNWSRLMMVLTAVLLGCFVFAWSYSLYGKWSAMLAAVLFSFSPNILAHARLITPDITVTTFSFISVYYFWRLLQNERWGDVVLGGITLGLALLSKFTSLLLLPIFLALILLWKLKTSRLNTGQVLVFAFIGIGILFLGYGLNLEPYFAGISFQLRHASDGHQGFLMGKYSRGGWWYYLLVAFLIKTPVVTLVFLALAVVLFFTRNPKGEWMDVAFLLVPAAVFFLFFSMEHQSIGLRYILPVYPFLFVLASRAARVFLVNKRMAALGVAAAVWYIAASFYIHPHYLAYYNELVGGPNNGYKYLVDSNLDWGQDLKGLKTFMEKNAISKINLSYFGSDAPERHGINYNGLPSFVLRNLDPEAMKKSTEGWFAISATDLQGVYFENRNLFASFRKQEPVAKIGYSIFVYKIDPPH